MFSVVIIAARDTFCKALKTIASCSESVIANKSANFFWREEQNEIRRISMKNEWLSYVHIYYLGELWSSRSGH